MGGLQGKPELNGRLGIVHGPVAGVGGTRGRVTVRLVDVDGDAGGEGDADDVEVDGAVGVAAATKKKKMKAAYCYTPHIPRSEEEDPDDIAS